MDRSNFIRRILWAVTLILGIVLVGSFIPTAQAATVINPSCGDTINPGDNVILGGDVGPCSTDPALMVDSAKLDLGGFTVSCGVNTVNGITVVGKKSKVSNGTVSGCKDGIFVVDEGEHTLERVTSKNNGEDGFDVESDGNKLIGNTAKDNFDRGFNIVAGADKNELAGNMATGNGGTGFHIDGADNKLTHNTASSNDGDGFNISGDRNKLSGNLADKNDGAGFGIPVGGNNNELTYNTASNNTLDDGFIIGGDGNKLGRNASFNNSGDGFEITVDGKNNKLQENLAVLNAVDGIRIADGGSNNDVLKNTAMGNSDVDLNDENANCDGNTWKKDLFGTKSQACIQ